MAESVLLIRSSGIKFADTNDKSITTVPIPEGINEIGEYAFQNCEKLEAVEIPQGVTKVSYCAFDACKALKSVTFTAAKKSSKLKTHVKASS